MALKWNLAYHQSIGSVAPEGSSPCRIGSSPSDYLIQRQQPDTLLEDDRKMKYLCLVYAEESRLGSVPDHECVAYDTDIRASGHCVASEALEPVETATTVRVRNGKASITDGPFAETKEQLAGFYMIEARDLNEAIQVASRIPPARVGSVEVRPIRPIREAVARGADGHRSSWDDHSNREA